MESRPQSVTALLADAQLGKREAVDRTLELVYSELRWIAASYLRRERRRDHTLQPTALVHEAYMRMLDQRDVTWKNRAHFLGIAAQVMRRLLLDHARRHGAGKRGGLLARVTLEGVDRAAEARGVDYIALDTALKRLAETDMRLSRIVELRYFGGLTIDETAEVLAVAAVTVERDWAFARAWLRRQLTGEV